MTIRLITLLALLGSMTIFVSCSPNTQAPAQPQAKEAQAPAAAQVSARPAGGVLQTQSTREKGLVIDVTECTRKDGVLTVKVAYRNTLPSETINRTLFLNELLPYTVAQGKKYLALQDSAGSYLAADPILTAIRPGDSIPWWAKFPAPPADVKAISLYIPIASPFEDLPITDR